MRRGQVWHADVPARGGPHYYLVISNDQRNANLDNVLVVSLTTRDQSRRAHTGTFVQLTPGDHPVRGWARCDNVFELWDDEVTDQLGVLSGNSMRRVEQGLRTAMALP